MHIFHALDNATNRRRKLRPAQDNSLAEWIETLVTAVVVVGLTVALILVVALPSTGHVAEHMAAVATSTTVASSFDLRHEAVITPGVDWTAA